MHTDTKIALAGLVIAIITLAVAIRQCQISEQPIDNKDPNGFVKQNEWPSKRDTNLTSNKNKTSTTPNDAITKELRQTTKKIHKLTILADSPNCATAITVIDKNNLQVFVDSEISGETQKIYWVLEGKVSIKHNGKVETFQVVSDKTYLVQNCY
ncbi:MAG: hypothetical protein H6565_12070 [Lewinellaceae bacterium]|nr:hypothetical protein [Lewinellaceae bacterium]MCB9355207.1 hypothetical protein [Lewinellaceae bacterium]